MEEVICYVKNPNLDLTIPYMQNGEEHNYIPDFIVNVKDRKDDPLNLVINERLSYQHIL